MLYKFRRNKTILIVLILTLSILQISMISSIDALSTSFHFPNNSENDNSNGGSAEWNYLSNIFDEDSECAEALISEIEGSTTCYLKATNFDFRLDSSDEITGIQVLITKGCIVSGGIVSPHTILDDEVKLVKNGNICSANKNKAEAWTNSLVEYTYGQEDSLWGESWSPTDINNQRFGVVISVRADNGRANIGIDCIKIIIHYNPGNTPPKAVDDSASTDEDTQVAISVLDNDVDADDDPLTIIDVSIPSHGSAEIDGDGTSTITYTPDENYNGIDTFTYRISDGKGGSATATVTVTVDPVNDDPVAVDDSETVDEDSSNNDFNVLSNDGDIDGDTLNLDSVSSASHGIVTKNGNIARYTPNSNYCGSDSFTYTITDGNGGTDTATVHVDVTCINDAPDQPTNPIPNGDSFPSDTEQVTLQVDVSDVESDMMDVTFLDGSDSIIGIDEGVASGNTASVDWAGLSSGQTYNWYVEIDDSKDITTSSIWSFSIQEASSNNPPVANDDSAEVDEDSSNNQIDVLANDDDPDGDLLNVSCIISSPSHGLASEDGDFVYYSPDPNYFGSDSFVYQITDNKGSSDQTATVYITVNNIDDIPEVPSIPNPADNAVDQPTSVTLSVYVEDLDDEELTVTFYNASDMSLLGVDTVDGSGTASYVWSGLAKNHTYSWYTSSSDGTTTVDSSIWAFKTAGYSTPSISFQSDDTTRNITVTATDAGVLWSNLSISGICDTSNLNDYVTVDDIISGCYGNIIITYDLTNFEYVNHEFPNNPPEEPINPTPSDGSTDVGINPTLKIDVLDIDGDFLLVTFYDGITHNEIDSVGISDGIGTATYSCSGLDYNTQYSWYVNVTDGSEISSSEIFKFTTKEDTSDHGDDDDGSGGNSGGGGRYVYIPPINNPPETPQITEKPVTEAYVNQECNFEVSSSDSNGDEIEFLWDFGDGGEPEWTSETTITHLWNEPGEYEVKVKARDEGGEESGWSDSFTMTILAIPEDDHDDEEVKITVSTLIHNNTIYIIPKDTSGITAEIVSYYWDFGDGNTSNKKTASHLYKNKGSYTVKLTITTEDDKSYTIEKEVIIHKDYKPIQSSGNVDNEDETSSSSSSSSDSKTKKASLFSFFPMMIIAIICSIIIIIFISYKRPGFYFDEDENVVCKRNNKENQYEVEKDKVTENTITPIPVPKTNPAKKNPSFERQDPIIDSSKNTPKHEEIKQKSETKLENDKDTINTYDGKTDHKQVNISDKPDNKKAPIQPVKKAKNVDLDKHNDSLKHSDRNSFKSKPAKKSHDHFHDRINDDRFKKFKSRAKSSIKNK